MAYWMSLVDPNVGQASLMGVWVAGGGKGTQRNGVYSMYIYEAHHCRWRL